TRERQRFLSWHVRDGNDPTAEDEPLLSVKWDRQSRILHITRSVLCHGWESYADVNGAILSRETIRRVRELVGTVVLDRFSTPAALRDELAALLFHAVVGASRLPLTSIESPLPAFALGQLFYVYRDYAREVVLSRPGDFVTHTLTPTSAPV